MTWEASNMKPFRTLDDVDVKGKRVLLRVDLNVPMENGRVTDVTRLERIAPTVTEISCCKSRVPDAVQRSSRCSAEPGPMSALDRIPGQGW